MDLVTCIVCQMLLFKNETNALQMYLESLLCIVDLESLREWGSSLNLKANLVTGMGKAFAGPSYHHFGDQSSIIRVYFSRIYMHQSYLKIIN